MRLLSLKQKNVDAYWKNKNPKLSLVLDQMNSLECWIQGEDFGLLSEDLMDMEQQCHQESRQVLADLSDEWVTSMAALTASQFFRLINWMDENKPGLSIHYIMEARAKVKQSEAAQLFVDRIKALQCYQQGPNNPNHDVLLEAVFAPSRVPLILEILKSESTQTIYFTQGFE